MDVINLRLLLMRMSMHGSRLSTVMKKERPHTSQRPNAAEDIKTMILAVWPFIRIEAAKPAWPAQPR